MFKIHIFTLILDDFLGNFGNICHIFVDRIGRAQFLTPLWDWEEVSWCKFGSLPDFDIFRLTSLDISKRVLWKNFAFFFSGGHHVTTLISFCYGGVDTKWNSSLRSKTNYKEPKGSKLWDSGAQHKAYMKEIKLSGRPTAKVSRLRHPGALRAQPWNWSSNV